MKIRLRAENRYRGAIDDLVTARLLYFPLDRVLHKVFNKSVEKFVENPTPGYVKVKIMNEF